MGCEVYHQLKNLIKAKYGEHTHTHTCTHTDAGREGRRGTSMGERGEVVDRRLEEMACC